MKKNSQYLIIPIIQGLGGFAIWFNKINLPDTMTITQAFMFMVFAIMIVILPRLFWILISSYIINLSKYIFYRLHGDEIISLCLYPFFVYESKKM